jgi:hypothetical protein
MRDAVKGRMRTPSIISPTSTATIASLGTIGFLIKLQGESQSKFAEKAAFETRRPFISTGLISFFQAHSLTLSLLFVIMEPVSPNS